MPRSGKARKAKLASTDPTVCWYEPYLLEAAGTANRWVHSEFNPQTQALIKEGKLSQNQLSTISKQDILEGKEDEIVEEIIAGRVQDAKAIENIVLSKQDIGYMVNKYMTELFYFQQKIRHLTSQLKYSDGLVDFTKKQHVRDAEGKLKDDLRLLQERIGEIIKKL
jgi:translation elongation factor EF-Ts